MKIPIIQIGKHDWDNNKWIFGINFVIEPFVCDHCNENHKRLIFEFSIGAIVLFVMVSI